MTEPSFLRSTRAAYDATASDYAEHFRTELAARPPERAILAVFAELVRAADAGPVADLGCGPGLVTAHLHELGLAAFGIDLSPQMVSVARRTYPELRFDEGSMTALDLPDATLAGIVAWYSIIHIPPDRVPGVIAEFHRTLSPGGHLLLAFQVGDQPRRLDEAFGRTISLEFHRFVPDRVADQLTQAGFVMLARLLREPDDNETVQQAYLLARKS